MYDRIKIVVLDVVEEPIILLLDLEDKEIVMEVSTKESVNVNMAEVAIELYCLGNSETSETTKLRRPSPLFDLSYESRRRNFMRAKKWTVTKQ